MDAKEETLQYLDFSLIDRDEVVDTIEGEKPLWFILEHFAESYASQQPSSLLVAEYIGKFNLYKDNGKWYTDNEGLLCNTDEELISMINKWLKSLQ